MRTGRPEVRAVAVVIRDGEVLLVQSTHSPDAWVAPGGKLEVRETLPQAAAREVWEETGIRVTMGPLIACRQAWWDTHEAVELYFAARPAAEPGEVGGGPEGRAARFVAIDQLPHTKHFPGELATLCALASDALTRGGVPCVFLVPLDMRS
jgi:8-oxo-dGTP diphosphatase